MVENVQYMVKVTGERVHSGYCVYVAIVDDTGEPLRPFQAFYATTEVAAHIKASNYLRWLLGSPEFLHMLERSSKCLKS